VDRHIWRAILWEFILSFAGIYTFAQAPTGTLAGRVVDPTGAAIPGARIVVTNKQILAERSPFAMPPTSPAAFELLGVGQHEIALALVFLEDYFICRNRRVRFECRNAAGSAEHNRDRGALKAS
jgi:hypothetical protein